jgi:hypothetical protein
MEIFNSAMNTTKELQSSKDSRPLLIFSLAIAVVEL